MNPAKTIDGFISDVEADRLTDLARRLSISGAIVEVGSYHGKSTAALAYGASDERTVFAVDPFTAYFGESENGSHQYEGNKDREIFEHNLKRVGLWVRVVHIALPSTHAASEWRYGGIAMVFIDACHDYASVKADIEAWRGLLQVGGLIVLHDANETGVQRAIDELSGFAVEGREGWLCWLRKLPDAPKPTTKRKRKAAAK